MAWDDKHKACIIATLATVEAGFNYGIITAPDTLSLGIGQWTQGRAYDLLQQFPDKNVFGPTIRSWLAAGKGTWTMARKYQSLGGTDRQKLSAALASEEGKKIQNNQMRKDLEGEYIPRLKAIGLDSEKYTEAGMLLIVVMHRWGDYARILNRLVASAGPAPTLDSMANAIKASGEWYAVGQRYVIAYRMIKNLDTKGITLAPGDSGGDNSKDGEDKAKEEKRIKHARTDGSGVLRIYMSDGSNAAAYPTVGGFWKANGADQKSDDGDDKKGGDGGGGGGGDSGKIGEMTRLAKASIGKYVYHQWYEPRLHPDKSGVTDCSGFVWWLYNKVMGMDIGKGGTTVLMSEGGKVIAEGGGRFNATSQIKEGDLIVCRWYSGGGHVEYCCETGKDTIIGQRGPDGVRGPAYGHAASLFSGCRWKLKRYV